MFIKLPDMFEGDSNKQNQYLMLEFQGSIENCNEEFQGKLLGSLSEKEKNVYSITIGMHLLEGKKIKIEKPILVMKNCKEYKSLIVQGICREKIIFNQRPLPIFNPQKKIKESTTPTEQQ